MVATPEVTAGPQEGLEHAQHAATAAVDVGRIDFLDGLRALAAMGVVVVHAFEMFGLGLGAFWGLEQDPSGLGEGLAGRAFGLAHELVVGQFVWAVEVFIVLSGFSLMLPVLRSPARSLRGGARRFFQGRVRRILPPYYAALLIGVLTIVIVPGMSEPSGSNNYRDLMIPITPEAALTHLLLVHNVSQAWDLKIVPPMWSIAVEWQIYLLFPLLVLLWRRAGALAAVAAALTFGLLQGALLVPRGLPVYPLSHPWYVGLFAMGMAAAALGFSPDPRARRLRAAFPWLSSSALVFAGMVGLKAVANRSGGLPEWIGDSLIGLAALCLLVHLARGREGPPGPLARALSFGPLARLGQISYSLYLIHTPVLAALSLLASAAGLSALAAHLLVLGLGVPLAVGAAYLFFVAYERPFLSRQARRHLGG